jgi:hypothetical protein
MIKWGLPEKGEEDMENRADFTCKKASFSINNPPIPREVLPLLPRLKNFML